MQEFVQAFLESAWTCLFEGASRAPKTRESVGVLVMRWSACDRLALVAAALAAIALLVWLVQAAVGFAGGGIVAFALTALVAFVLPRMFGEAFVVSHRALVQVSPNVPRTKIYWREVTRTSRSPMGLAIEVRDRRRVFVPWWQLRGDGKRILLNLVSMSEGRSTP